MEEGLLPPRRVDDSRAQAPIKTGTIRCPFFVGCRFVSEVSKVQVTRYSVSDFTFE